MTREELKKLKAKVQEAEKKTAALSPQEIEVLADKVKAAAAKLKKELKDEED